MEKVIVPAVGRYKCVLLSDGKNYAFRADEGEFHSQVSGRVKDKEPELKKYHVAGGGRVEINENTIEVYGYSVDFGNMDKEVIEELVSEYAKKEGLTFINRTGEGY